MMNLACKNVLLFVVLFIGGASSQEGRSQLATEEVPHIIAIWEVVESTAVLHDKATVVGNQTIFKCAGVLVTNDTVLTTISCLDETRYGLGAQVSGGHLKRGDASHITFHDVVEEIRHEQYDDVTMENDIVLLKVSPGFEEEPNVYPIKISKQAPEPGTICTAAGWRFSFFYTSDDLRTKTVLRVNNNKCNDVVSSYTSPQSRDAGEGVEGVSFGGRKFCAADAYNEECTVGDEGGPLVCDGSLAGLFSSYILVCLETDPEPAFYHDIAHYADWIVAHAPEVEVYDNGGSSVNYSMATLALVTALVAMLN